MNLPHHRRHHTTPTPRQLINRIERGNTLRDAIELARVTLP